MVSSDEKPSSAAAATSSAVSAALRPLRARGTHRAGRSSPSPASSSSLPLECRCTPASPGAATLLPWPAAAPCAWQSSARRAPWPAAGTFKAPAPAWLASHSLSASTEACSSEACSSSLAWRRNATDSCPGAQSNSTTKTSGWELSLRRRGGGRGEGWSRR
eukprot:scaffold43906_cov63-Phaeocystis_antarctica.AAC.1